MESEELRRGNKENEEMRRQLNEETRRRGNEKSRTEKSPERDRID